MEIGTVTLKPQIGNEKPRLFRIPKDKNLFNRMGFNNLGAKIISDRLKKIKPELPLGFKVGVNLGKNKNTSDQDAASDYASVAECFIDCADYFVINVSSPNTPGLRSLQTKESLVPILQAVQNVIPNHKKNPHFSKTRTRNRWCYLICTHFCTRNSESRWICTHQYRCEHLFI